MKGGGVIDGVSVGSGVKGGCRDFLGWVIPGKVGVNRAEQRPHDEDEDQRD
jgi:hypothetical protein